MRRFCELPVLKWAVLISALMWAVLIGGAAHAQTVSGQDLSAILAAAQAAQQQAAAALTQAAAAKASADASVKTVQSIGPDGTGNVSGIATSSMLSNVVIAGDVIQVLSPSTGATVTPAQGATVVLINNSALLLALTVTMPTNPADGQRFTVASASGITALTLPGSTIKGGLTGLSVAGYARFIYSASAGYWFRIG